MLVNSIAHVKLFCKLYVFMHTAKKPAYARQTPLKVESTECSQEGSSFKLFVEDEENVHSTLTEKDKKHLTNKFYQGIDW